MKSTKISSDNKLQEILDFKGCRYLVNNGKKKNEDMVILCPHYSINVQSHYSDGEQLEWDLDELSDFIGHYVEVTDYDDLVVVLNSNED